MARKNCETKVYLPVYGPTKQETLWDRSLSDRCKHAATNYLPCVITINSSSYIFHKLRCLINIFQILRTFFKFIEFLFIHYILRTCVQSRGYVIKFWSIYFFISIFFSGLPGASPAQRVFLACDWSRVSDVTHTWSWDQGRETTYVFLSMFRGRVLAKI